MNGFEDRITTDPDILNGKPAIRGQRISVQTILDFLSNGDQVYEILEQYPSLEKEDIYACLKFASDLMQNNYQVESVAA